MSRGTMHLCSMHVTIAIFEVVEAVEAMSSCSRSCSRSRSRNHSHSHSCSRSRSRSCSCSCTVCLGSTNIFFSIFICYAWFGMVSKGMVESFLLSKDEPLTPNIDGVMALWIFWRRAQTAKNLRKLDLSILVFDIFAPAPSSVRAQFFQGWHCSCVLKSLGLCLFTKMQDFLFYFLGIQNKIPHLSITYFYCLFGVN